MLWMAMAGGYVSIIGLAQRQCHVSTFAHLIQANVFVWVAKLGVFQTRPQLAPVARYLPELRSSKSLAASSARVKWERATISCL